MCVYYTFFFFNDTATTEIYTLSLHDALPISRLRRCDRRRAAADLPLHLHLGRHGLRREAVRPGLRGDPAGGGHLRRREDRKSTRLNSSHANISYAVFCLKKKKIKQISETRCI